MNCQRMHLGDGWEWVSEEPPPPRMVGRGWTLYCKTTILGYRYTALLFPRKPVERSFSMVGRGVKSASLKDALVEVWGEVHDDGS